MRKTGKKIFAGMIAVLLLNADVFAVFGMDHQAWEEYVRADDVTVTFTRSYDHNMESAEITGVSAQGEVLWTYATGAYQRAQLDRISEIGTHEGVYYMVEDGTILAFDTSDGAILWANSDFGGCASCSAFDENGTLYVSGYFGPDLFIADAEGNTVVRIDSLNSGYTWPYEMTYLRNSLAITFEMTPSGGSGILYVDLDDYSSSAVSDTFSSYGVISEAVVSQDAISSVTATSYLEEPQYGLDHKPSYVIDGTLYNAWVENAPGQGEGECLTIELDDVYLVSGFEINAGYQKSTTTYTNNSRPSELSVTFSDGSSLKVYLHDYNGRQTVTFPSVVETSSVSFTIQSVYPGVKYEDTVISEISLF